MRKLMVLLVAVFAVLNLNAANATTGEFVNVDGTNYTDVPINGAFGWKFGDIFNDPGPHEVIGDKGERKKIPSYSINKDDGNRRYWAMTPPQLFSRINQYDLTVTPETKRIAKIQASFCSKNKEIAEDFYKDLCDGLTAKYGTFTIAKNKSGEGENERIVFINKNNPKRKINISVEKRNDGYTVIRLEYVDTEILKSEKKLNIQAL